MEKSLMDTILVTALIMLALGGVGLLLNIRSKAEIARRKRLRAWPTALGQVTTTCLEQKPATWRSLVPRYLPRVCYIYVVNGTQYQSSRYKNSGAAFNRRQEWNTLRRSEALRIAASFPPGSPVSVHYNPQDPQEAYLALDTATARQHAWRLGGLAHIAVALLFLVNGAGMVWANQVDLAYALNLRPVIPVDVPSLRTGLEHKFGLRCNPAGRNIFGPAIDYKVWTCANPTDSDSPLVWIYSRASVPDKVDYIEAFPGRSGNQASWTSLSRVAALTAQGDTTQQVQAWVEKSSLALYQGKLDAGMSTNGVNYILTTQSNGAQRSLELQIGAKQ